MVNTTFHMHITLQLHVFLRKHPRAENRAKETDLQRIQTHDSPNDITKLIN